MVLDGDIQFFIIIVIIILSICNKKIVHRLIEFHNHLGIITIDMKEIIHETKDSFDGV